MMATPRSKLCRKGLQCWLALLFPTVRFLIPQNASVVTHLTFIFIGEIMSRRIFAPFLAIVMSAGLVLAGTMPAAAVAVAPATAVQAAKPAPNKVTIGKIKTAKVSKKTKKATVKPSVKSTGQVKVTSSKITVKQGKKTVAKNVSSASLRAGKYSVVTTAKYKTWTNKTTTKDVKKKSLVSDGSKLVKMNCKVADIEPQYFEGLFIDLLLLECTGDFDGVYKARAGYVLDIEENWFLAGDMIWGESFPDEPQIRSVQGLRFTTNVYPLEHNVYKTTMTKQKTTKKVWSKEQTKTLSQTLTVKK